MNRPYVICLMTSTINGKCSGRFYQLPEADAARRANAAARDFYDCGAILYGTKTMTESYGTVEDLEPSAERYPRADYLPACETDQFLISIDPGGGVSLPGRYIVRNGRPPAQAVQVLSYRLCPDDVSQMTYWLGLPPWVAVTLVLTLANVVFVAVWVHKNRRFSLEARADDTEVDD